MVALGTVMTFVTDQFSAMVTTISGEPLMLIPVGIFVIGASIGLVKRVLG